MVVPGSQPQPKPALFLQGRSQPPPGPHRPDIAIVLQHPCWGGVETAFLNLTRHFAGKGLSIDVLFSSTDGPLYDSFKEHASVIDLKNTLMKLHRRERYAFLDYPKVKRYIQVHRPRSVLSAKSVSNYCVARAKKELGYPDNVVISQHIDADAGREALNPIQRAVGNWHESYYRYADAAVGVSKGAAQGLLKMGLPPGKVHTIYDPTVTDEIFRLAEEQPPHKWLHPRRTKVILGTGRFTGQKDFETLIRAFRAVLNRVECRLIIIGEGPDRGKLERLVKDLRLTEQIDLPGYMKNPYSFMKNADLYVLSSRYEGLAMTLVEAMALGTPVVSTDCPCGPAEVLSAGAYGTLVPVGDYNALAEAMVDSLTRPRDTSAAARWAKETFSVETAAEKYLSLLFARGTAS